MSTTNLFVELLVIGVGAACWVALLLYNALGTDWLDAEILDSYPVLAVILAVVYLLGIVTDRVSDYLFDTFCSNRIRSRYFAEKRDYQDARRLVLSSSGRLADMHEYGRTRIRICRGWAVNAAAMSICWALFVLRHAPNDAWRDTALLYGSGGCATLSVAAWWSWELLCAMEYLKIREHAEFLKSTLSLPGLKSAA